jgi:hypothetical protein
MARLELPSGGFVEYRDQLLAGDKFAVQGAIMLKLQQSGEQEISGGIQNQMRNALLRQIITAWGYENVAVPANHPHGVSIIGEVMPIDDYNTLSEAVEPLLAKVSFAPNPQRSTS